ncbi:hypothetical protein C2S53_008423 [Perilla frutescens var. hirtella]|uniref:Glutamate receptor n=1 Tax=Perilla frutescens var. hirtella TaxID=608512 RepID=A0AAD4IUH1_PERFH|nr:hypothetical protein C2S53_008423 [Perilla frutescens var. hirtella]
MQILKLCLLHLLLFQSFHFTPLNGLNATAAKADVGVILDLQTTVGKIFKTCISMAIEDFYAENSYNTMIVPHFKDSNSDAVAATSAAIDLLKNTQVMAIFGPQRSTQAAFVIDICDRVKVPIISPATSPALSPQESPYFIRSAWSSASQAKAVAAIVKNFGWREIVLVYEDSNYGSGLLPFLTKDLLKSNSLVSNISLISPSAGNDRIVEQLNELKKMQTRVFVVHMLPSLASRFFNKANEAGMMEEGYVWIISDVLTDLLDSVDSETIEAMQGVLGVRASFPRSNEVRNFTMRWKKRFYKENPEMERTELNVFGLWAYDSMAALVEAVERVGGTSPNFKKVTNRGNLTDLEAIGTSNTGSSLVRFIRNFTSKGLSGNFKISNGELQPSTFEIINVIGRGANRVGFWTEKHGISKNLNGNDSNKSLGAIVWPGQTSDIPKGWEASSNAKKLRIGVPVRSRTSELIKVETDKKGNLVNASGFCIDVFEEVMRSLQYSVQFEYFPFNNSNVHGTGYQYDDLIEQLFLKNYDAVVADFTISGNRSIYVDFTIPYIESGVSTVAPIEDYKNAWVFMEPLTMGLWLTIGAFFIFTGFVIWALEHRENEEFRGPPHQQVGMVFWFSFSTLVFAHREKVKSNLSRFVVIVWLFVVLVLTSSYTASLTSMLTVQQLEPADIHDLTEKGEYVGYKAGHLVEGFLDSKNCSKLRMYTTFEEYDEALSKGSGNGGVAAVVDNLPSLRIFLSEYCHKYTMIGPTYRPSGFGFAFQKGSLLAPDVSRAILQLKESGKMDEISRNWFREEGCDTRNGTVINSKSLDIDYFKGLFLICGLSSFAALAASLLIFFYQNRNVITSRASSFKRKLCELINGAFDRERDVKSSSSKEPSIILEEIVGAERERERERERVLQSPFYVIK